MSIEIDPVERTSELVFVHSTSSAVNFHRIKEFVMKLVANVSFVKRFIIIIIPVT